MPLRVGGGTRLKIFEALAMGKAVVSTTVGAEGLGIEPGTHVELADDPQAFADVVVRLLRDCPAREALGRHGRALVEDGTVASGDARVRAAPFRSSEDSWTSRRRARARCCCVMRASRSTSRASLPGSAASSSSPASSLSATHRRGAGARFGGNGGGAYARDYGRPGVSRV